MILTPNKLDQMPSLLYLYYSIPQYNRMLLLLLLPNLSEDIQSHHSIDAFYRGFYLHFDAIEVLLQLGELTEGSASLKGIRI